MSKPAATHSFNADFATWLPSFNLEAMMAAHRKNIEAMTAVNQAVFESIQGLAARQAELMRQGLIETTGMVKAMMASPAAPREHIMRHADASKATVDKCMDNARHIAETIATCNRQAVETVSRRLSEGLDELRDMMKTARAA